MFRIVEYPSSVPTDNLDTSYKRQNKIIEHMKYLHASNDGIILSEVTNENPEAPFIMAGSICLFCETFFYTSEHIFLLDEDNKDGMRCISLTYNIIDKTLLPKIESRFMGKFKEERGSRYYFDEGIIKKYLNFSMYCKMESYGDYNFQSYYSKKYLAKEQG